MSKRERYTRIGIVAAIGIAMGLLSAGYLYLVRAGGGELYSVRQASTCFWPLLRQNLLTSLFPIVLLAGCALWLKKDFPDAMGLSVKGKKQGLTVGILASALGVMTIAVMAAGGDRAEILYSLFYYTVLVAFQEEFIFRGLCGCLLKDQDRKLRYLVPSLLFALIHILAYNDFGALTGGYVLSFLLSDVLGLFVMGCAFQFLKEKTGTLWVPILIHAICDFQNVFT